MIVSDLLYRLRALVYRRRMDQELEEELRFHVEREAEKYRGAGMREDDARRRARLAFGGHEQIKEDVREAHGTGLMEQCWQDIRYALRLLGKNPGFTAIAVVTLALGIGASSAAFSLVDVVLLRPLPYPNAARDVMLWGQSPPGSYYASVDMPFSAQEFILARETQSVFRNFGAFRKKAFNLTGAGLPELQEGVEVSAGFFAALGEPAMLGRTITAQDDQPGHERVAVLSEWLWRSKYQGDRAVVGKTIHVNGYAMTVIGVMPASFGFPDGSGMPVGLDVPRKTALWVPMALPPGARGSNDMGVVGEPKPGVTEAQLREELARFDQRFVEFYPQAKGYTKRAVALSEQAVTDTRRPLLLWMGAVLVVLLIACSNVAGLTLNRSLSRRREFTVRGALGARRGRLMRQIVIENMLLSVLGGGLGLVVAKGGLWLVQAFGPSTLPHLHEAGINLTVAGFAMVVTLGTGLLFGLAPAIGSTRMNLVDALKDGGQRNIGGATAPRIRNGLLIVQVALALMLVVSAGLLLRSFYTAQHAATGFDTTRVVTFEVPLPTSPRYQDTDRMAQTYGAVLQRLQAIPGVETAGFASFVPMGGETDSTIIRIPGRPRINQADAPGANYQFVSPGFFQTMGTPLEEGRDFANGDVLTTQSVAIINQTMAKKYWPGQDAIGKQVGVGMVRIPLRTIVGVVADTKQTSLREEPSPEMYVPYTQNEIKVWPSMQTMQYALRLRGDGNAIEERVRKAVNEVDPDLPIAQFAELRTMVNASMAADRFALLLLGVFGLLALVLATLGMYGVIAYSVQQRTTEIGLRMALGADRRTILGMVLRQGGTLALSGIAMGLVGASITTRLMTTFLYGVRAFDPQTFAAVALLLLAIALIACWVPARRAMGVSPTVALRYE
ncbi:ABC transporter permease [Acidobacteria bacterium AB60]|nr:ABC transporter permease [Acidobacteria bacterium AB60]